MTATATVRDRRVVELNDLPIGCLSWTPAGRVPISCHSVEICFDISTGDLRAVMVRGTLIEDVDIRRRAAGFRTGDEKSREYEARGTIIRRYSIDWRTHTAQLPKWLADYVEQYRP